MTSVEIVDPYEKDSDEDKIKLEVPDSSPSTLPPGQSLASSSPTGFSQTCFGCNGVQQIFRFINDCPVVNHTHLTTSVV